jgi:hypothetical protein
MPVQPWDIESVSTNWHNNIIGATGGMYKGFDARDSAINSSALVDPDGAGPLRALAFVSSVTTGDYLLIASNYQNVVDDSLGYIGILGASSSGVWEGSTNAIGLSNRRTLTLSTGDIIWDIAGNASEWVQNPFDFTGFTSSSALVSLTGAAKLRVSPKGTYSAATNIGRISINGTTASGLCSRGAIAQQHFAGVNLYSNVFTVDNNSAGLKPQHGFRCVYQP